MNRRDGAEIVGAYLLPLGTCRRAIPAKQA